MISDIMKKRLGFKEHFKYTYKIVFKQIKSLFILTLVYLPFSFLYLYIFNKINLVFKLSNTNINLDLINFLLNVLSGQLLSAFSQILITFVTLAIIYITYEAIKNNNETKINIKDSINFAISNWKTGFLTALLYEIITFALGLLFCVPGLIYMILYIFALQVVAIKKLKYKDALDYSAKTARGHWWYLFVVPFISNPILILILIFSLSITGLKIELPFYIDALRNYLNHFSSIITIIITTILFLNLEVFHEDKKS